MDYAVILREIVSILSALATLFQHNSLTPVMQQAMPQLLDVRGRVQALQAKLDEATAAEAGADREDHHEHRIAELEKVVADLHTYAFGQAEGRALEKAVADLHASLSDAPAPKGVQEAVADVDVPQPK